MGFRFDYSLSWNFEEFQKYYERILGILDVLKAVCIFLQTALMMWI